MKLVSVVMSMMVGYLGHAECVEGDFTAAPYCFTPAQARYTCENSGATQAGLDQVVQCLDSWVAQNGQLETLDRANCIGEDVISEVAAENVARCSGR